MHCTDHQSELQNQSHNAVVEALLRVMHEFLLFHVKQHHSEAEQEGAASKGVGMFYIHSTAALESKDTTLLADQKTATMSEVPGATSIGAQRRGSNNPDVNDIIVKIEMKKFQNLIENRIKHKNNLLQADMKRVYPLTKKPRAGGMTLYD